MSDPTAPEEHLPLSPLSTAVLLALADGDRHGYAIIQEIERQSEGRLAPGAGSLYAALRRMVEDGLLREAERPAGAEVDSRRRYYALTEPGRRVLGAELRRLRRLLDGAAARRLAPAFGAAGGAGTTEEGA